MPGLSASQEMQLEYVTWHAPESPPIDIRRRAMDGIHREVSEAFAAAEFLMDYLKTSAPFWKKQHGDKAGAWVEAKVEDDAAAKKWRG